MSGPSAIEWTERTWNPVVGCSIHSAGCTNCYAMKMAGRLEAMASAHGSAFDGDPGPLGHYLGTTVKTKAGFVWTGKVNVAPDSILLEPLRVKKGATWFVNSMSDLYHEDVPDDVIDRVFAVMALAPQHTFQLLTKRAERMRAYLAGKWHNRVIPYLRQWQDKPEGYGVLLHTTGGALPNVWLGVSVEDQRAADARIPDLLATPAAVRFLSCEPLLGPVDLTRVKRFPAGVADKEFVNAVGGRMWTDQSGLPNPDPRWDYPGIPFSEGRGLDWVITGGESGKGARPMHPDWARSLRDQCAAAGVPFFFKQWGEWGPDTGPEKVDGRHILLDRVMEGKVACAVRVGDDWRHFDDGYAVPIELCSGHGAHVYRFGKKAAGRLLDGMLHDGIPA